MVMYVNCQEMDLGRREAKLSAGMLEKYQIG
jgi:hypothetical protein